MNCNISEPSLTPVDKIRRTGEPSAALSLILWSWTSPYAEASPFAKASGDKTMARQDTPTFAEATVDKPFDKAQDGQRNFFRYCFGFWKVPVRKGHSRGVYILESYSNS